MTAEEKEAHMREVAYRKWKANASVIKPLELSDKSDDTDEENKLDQHERNKLNPQTGERYYVENRRKNRQADYSRKNLYNLDSDEDELDFI